MYENSASGVYQPQIQEQNMTEQATEEMGRYIWKILLSGGPIAMSWGSHLFLCSISRCVQKNL